MVEILETTITAIYFLLVLGIGYYFKDRDSADDYWSAGGGIGTAVNSMAIFAAVASGGTFLGTIGVAYALGATFMWAAIIGSAPGFAIGAILLAKPLRRVDRHTISDLFDYLFEDKRINTLVPLLVLFGMFLYIVAQLKAAGFTMQYLLDVSYVPAVTLAGLIFIAYVTLGGMWAITITDFIQGSLMWLLMLVIAGISLAHFGFSVTAPLTETPSIASIAPLPVESFIGFTLINGIAVIVFPHVIMRAFTSESPESARRAYSWMGFGYAVFCVISFYLIAAAAISIAPELSNPDLALIAIMEELLPTVIAGFTAAAILAAVMSSTDAFLLAMSASVSNDLYKGVINPEADDERVVRIGRASSIVLGLMTIVAAWNPPELLVSLYVNAIGLWASAFFFPMILGIWWKRMNRTGAFAGIVLGTVIYGIGYFTLPDYSGVIPALIVCLLACIAGAIVGEPRTAEKINELSDDLGHSRVGW